MSKARPRVTKEKSNTTKRPRVNKAKSNKAKRPLTDYMKFAAAQRKTDAIKALPPREVMVAIGKLWRDGGKTKTLRETPVSDVESDDGFSDESDFEIDDNIPPVQPARMRNKGKKGGPKKGASKPKTNKARRTTRKVKTTKYGKGMTMEGGKWQDYIPPEVKSMAMKQARKFAGKVIASDDLFGSGMYRD